MDKIIELEHQGIQLRASHGLVVDAILERLRGQGRAPALSGSMPRIGDYWTGQGGLYAGMMKGVNGVADYPLILPTAPSAYFKDVTWGPRGVEVPDASCDYDGRKNTQALLAAEGEYPAAKKCSELVIEGHRDFYLGARREYALVYANLHDKIELGDWYWTSTQYSANNAWCQYFGYGNQYTDSKNNYYRVRAVRRVL